MRYLEALGGYRCVRCRNDRRRTRGGTTLVRTACRQALAPPPPTAGSTRLSPTLVLLLAVALVAGTVSAQDSLTLRAWAADRGVSDEFPTDSFEWTVTCGRDELTGRSTGCVLHSPAYLVVGSSQPAPGLGNVGVDCEGRVFAKAGSGAKATRYVVPSVTGNDYRFSPWRLRTVGSGLGDWLSRQSADLAAQIAVNRALADDGWLFTADNTAWAGETFAFEVEGGSVFRLPLSNVDRERVDAFLAGPRCR